MGSGRPAGRLLSRHHGALRASTTFCSSSSLFLASDDPSSDRILLGRVARLLSPPEQGGSHPAPDAVLDDALASRFPGLFPCVQVARSWTPLSRVQYHLNCASDGDCSPLAREGISSRLILEKDSRPVAAEKGVAKVTREEREEQEQ
jgi:hypothetical protein